ncbi:hypothetical protein UlMin_007905 [Ulmus minor]
MAASMLIKVKYGDTLRRFCARTNERDQLEFDMAGLRAKVASLFNFNPDADFTMTYVDEDDDVVTLVDDNDLRELETQDLDIVRIDVKLNNEKVGNAGSSGSSTPTPSRSYAEVARPVPDPLHEVISKLSLEFANAMSLNPMFSDLIKSVTKTIASPSLPGGETSRHSGTSEGLSVPAAAAISKIPEPVGEALSNLAYKAVFPKLDENEKLPSSSTASQSQLGGQRRGQSWSCNNWPRVRDWNFDNILTTGKASNADGKSESKTGNVAGGGAAKISPSVDLNKPPVDCDSSENFSTVGSDGCAGDEKQGDEKQGRGKQVAFETFVPVERKQMKQMNWDLNGKSIDRGASAASSVQTKHVNSGPSGATEVPNFPFNECPFAGFPFANESFMPQLAPSHPFKMNHNESMGGIFHRGVRCDGCGVHPITGPRFVSKVKHNYDLCRICFSEMGNENEYIKIDRPFTFRHPRSFKEALGQHQLWAGPQASPKLDSRFILDVNVMDGTLMAPSTPFTKIWKMRNCGQLVWPRGTQLVWIGGDKFGASDSVELEIPADGVHADNELDIAVDFVSPQLPGRHISYWRMASPSGQKFGQRVWVLIHVEVSLKDSFSPLLQGLNLNLPQGSGTNSPTNANAQIGSGWEFQQTSSYGIPQQLKPFQQPLPQPQPLPQNHDHTMFADLLPVAPMNKLPKDTGFNGYALPSAPMSNSHAATPIIDLEEEPSNVDIFPPLAPAVVSASAIASTSTSTSTAASPVVSATQSPVATPSTTAAASPVVSAAQSPIATPSTSEATSAKNAVEESLLKELYEMGFNRVDLNKETLRLNDYDLEQTVEDLCAVADWDPILEDLQEMGFHDAEMNKKLLVKNNGSIKRVVMDLVTGEKAGADE